MTSSIIVVLKGNMEETNHLLFACATAALTGVAVFILKENKEETVFFFISALEND